MTVHTYDVIVIGAGPSGAIAARQCARIGASVLLLDRKSFPRDKPCGCCINIVALDALSRIGLSEQLKRLEPVPLNQLRITIRGRTTQLDLPGGVTVPRDAFDQMLVDAAMDAGVVFIDRAPAILAEADGTRRTVRIPGRTFRARAVIFAAGLAGGRHECGQPPRVSPRSYMGIAATLPNAGKTYDPGVIHMVCGRRGYLGLVRLSGDRLNIAAALDPAYLKATCSPARGISRILHDNGMDGVPDLHEAQWLGTPKLTQSPARVADDRMYCIGDAAGYVEPFTGEGIGWALATGIAVAPFATSDWRPDRISQWHAALRGLRRRQRLCRAVRLCLRSEPLSSTIVRGLGARPALARRLMRMIHQPLILDTPSRST